MPKFLHLIRHAQSADKQHGQSDKERELTTVGVRDSVQIGNFLKNQNFFPDLVLSSSANRAFHTASLISDSLQINQDQLVSNDELYDASIRILLQQINEVEDHIQQLLVVAHNPAISYLAEYISSAEIGDMVPAGLCSIKLNIASWKEVAQNSGELLHYVYPQLLTE